MRWDTFWRWYDWVARVHFAGTILSAIIGAAAGLAAYFEGWNWLAIFFAMLGAFAAVGVLYLTFCNLWDRFSPSAHSLKYLRYRDSSLEDAIDGMAHHSAWGRWFAAQHLVNQGVV